MLRKELLDARKALRSVREGVSGPRSKKQRGEWELVVVQDCTVPQQSIKWAVGSFNRLNGRLAQIAFFIKQNSSNENSNKIIHL